MKIADLKKAQAEAEEPDCGGTSLNKDSIDEPAVKEGTDAGKTTLNIRHRPVIDGVDVEAIGEERDAERVLGGIAIELSLIHI